MECASYELRVHHSRGQEICRQIVNTTQPDNVCVRGNAHYSQAGSEILVSAELMDVSPHTEFICSVDATLEGQQRTHASINVTSDVTGATVTCEGLTPFKGYTLHVTATNAATGGSGSRYESSSEVVFNTLEGVPTEPRALNLHLVQHNAVRVTWDKPADPCGVLKNYLVTLWAGDDLVVQKNESHRDVTYPDLSFLTHYHVQVGAL
ncbi:unnamed protein product [Lampetra fluviatilis]